MGIFMTGVYTGRRLPGRTRSVPDLFDLRAVVRQAFPGTALIHGRHTANNSSSTVPTLNHRVIAFFETRQPDISHDLRLHIADIALRELIVCRIVRIFDQSSLILAVEPD